MKRYIKLLWEDLFLFLFSENNYDNFDSDSEEYFLAPIVIYKNDDGNMKIIDGQQCLTTLILLLCAFYDMFKNFNRVNSNQLIFLIFFLHFINLII